MDSRNRLTDPASGEWCCNHIDCREEKVSETAGGYRVETGETIPYQIPYQRVWPIPCCQRARASRFHVIEFGRGENTKMTRVCERPVIHASFERMLDGL